MSNNRAQCNETKVDIFRFIENAVKELGIELCLSYSFVLFAVTYLKK